ncbi:hypothetical protein Tco_0007982 [Tanacetum coccineum]
MLPEWGRFVTAVKLNKGLKDSNTFDQLVDRIEDMVKRAHLSATTANGVGHISKELHSTQAFYRTSEYFKDKMFANEAQENGVVLDEEQLIVPSWWDRTMLLMKCVMMNWLHFDAICEHHEEHGMQDDVQPSYVVGSHSDYMSDSNMTSYDQYVKDNAVPVVQNNASMVPNDIYVMIDNDLHEPKT